MKNKFALILFVCGIVFTSCSSSKKITKNIEPLDYTYFSSKIKTDYSAVNSSTISFTINYRAKKDSIIWASILGPFNIEAARILITQDSVHILNKLQKKYDAYSITEYAQKSGYPLDFRTIQHLIMGEMLFEGTDYKVRKDSSFQIVEQKIKDVTINNYFDSKIKRITKVNGNQLNSENAIQINYKDFEKIDGKVIPIKSDLFLKIINNELNIESAVKLEHTKASFPSEPLSFPFQVNEKYNQ